MAIKRISELDAFTSADLRYFLSAENIRDTDDIIPNPASNANANWDTLDYSKLSAGLLFEVSTPLSGLSCITTEYGDRWIVKPVNEAPSYYLSKKINAADLGNILCWEVKNELNRIRFGPFFYIGSQNFGEPICCESDGIDTYWYDNRTTISDFFGNEVDNRLCVMVSSDFTNNATFHRPVYFHSNVDFYSPVIFHSSIIAPSAHFTNLTVDNDIYGCCLCARWADLAENYESDFNYLPGTLVEFGGEKEITIASNKVNAVVTSKPGFVLNGTNSEDSIGIALTGRVPVRVVGKVNKFDKIGLSEIPGVGKKVENKDYIGLSLEKSDIEEEKLVECVVQLSL